MILGGIQFSERNLSIGMINWVLLEAGSGEPVMLLHGFPDTPHTFSEQAGPLIEQGYKVIIPWLPGYAPSTINNSKYYPTGQLGADLSALIEALGYESLSFVGHDWGGFAGYLLAVTAPQRINKLVTVAIPQSKAYSAAGLKQLWRSRYMFLFQLPGSEALVRHNNFDKIDRLYAEWSPDWEAPEAHIQAIKKTLANPVTLSIALGYYRQMFRGAFTNKDLREKSSANIPVDCLAIAGRNDGCIGIECLEQQAAGFDANYRLEVIDGAGHFCHAEKPLAFNELLLAYLSEA